MPIKFSDWHIGIFYNWHIIFCYIFATHEVLSIHITFLIGTAASAHAQGRSGSRGGRGGFSLSNLSSSNKEIPDSLLQTDKRGAEIQNESSVIGSRLFWENVISLLWIPID